MGLPFGDLVGQPGRRKHWEQDLVRLKIETGTAAVQVQVVR